MVGLSGRTWVRSIGRVALALVLGLVFGRADAEAAIAFVKPIGIAGNRTVGTPLTVTVPVGGVAVGHTVIVAVALAASLWRRHEWLPFLLALALFALSMAGLGVSVFPDIVPGAVSIQDGAAPHSSLVFMLVGAGILIPIILAYTAYSYWIFRGKVGHEGYH